MNPSLPVLLWDGSYQDKFLLRALLSNDTWLHCTFLKNLILVNFYKNSGFKKFLILLRIHKGRNGLKNISFAPILGMMKGDMFWGSLSRILCIAIVLMFVNRISSLKRCYQNLKVNSMLILNFVKCTETSSLSMKNWDIWHDYFYLISIIKRIGFIKKMHHGD